MAPLTAPEAEEVRGWLTTIGTMLQSDEFTGWNAAFMKEHCSAFEDAEENKLEHTELHQRYQEEVERRIGAAVQGAGVDLEALMVRLPAFMEVAKGDAADLMDSAVYETIDTLTSLSDFEHFKAAMLVAKRERVGGTLDVGQGSLDDVSGAHVEQNDMARFITLAQTMDAETEGWVELVNKSWMVMSKRPAPAPLDKTHVLCRYMLDLDLEADHVANVFGDYGPDRVVWDDTYTASEVVCENPAPAGGGRDIVVRGTFKMPYLVRLAGFPDKTTLRTCMIKGQPRPGEWTIVACAWDEAKNALDEKNNFFQTALGVVRPHPDDPSRTRYTGFEQMGLAKVPNWLMGWLAGQFAPKLMLGYVDKYKKRVLMGGNH